MDSREVHQPSAVQLQQPQWMVMGPTSTYPANSTMINPNQSPAISSAAAGFPFNSLAPAPPAPQSQPQPQQPKPMDSLNSASCAYDLSPQLRYNTEPAAKKKRGRPRKYIPDGGIGLQLATTTPVPSASINHGDSVSLGSSGNGGGGGGSSGAAATEPPAKKNRGRPPGSGKKQLDALGGVGGVGFTPHVITVKAGEDIASKIMAFSREGPRTVCILSANGAICNVTLRQPAMSGGTVTYEGRFEIISLSGSFLLSENNGSRSRTGGLSVSLAGSDGRVLGGGVAGMLMAASHVQVIVGSFIADGKKQNPSVSKTGPSSVVTPQMLNFGAAGAPASPPSQGGSSDSSDENDASPVNRGGGFFGNPTPSIHNNNSQMYPLWSSQAP